MSRKFCISERHTDHGWVILDFKLGEREFWYSASYLGPQPVFQLIKIAAHIPEEWKDQESDCEEGYKMGPLYYYLEVSEEPGMLILEIKSCMKTDKIMLKVYTFEDAIYGDHGAIKVGNATPDCEVEITHSDFYHAVFDAAASSLVKQGVLGLTTGWWSDNVDKWDPEKEIWAFPMAQFYKLAGMLHNWPETTFEGENSFERELALLKMLKDRYSQEALHRPD